MTFSEWLDTRKARIAVSGWHPSVSPSDTLIVGDGIWTAVLEQQETGLIACSYGPNRRGLAPNLTGQGSTPREAVIELHKAIVETREGPRILAWSRSDVTGEWTLPIPAILEMDI